MANLNATTNSAGQSTTQSPQTAVASGVAGASTGGVQSGTPTDLLRSSSGIPLTNTPPTAINLNQTNASTTALPATKPKHHVNGVLLGLSALLIVAAVAMFVIAGRSVKSTT